MAGSKPFFPSLASTPAAHFGQKAALAPSLARYLTPKELSGRLNEAGIRSCEDSIRRRCRLPQSHALHIATNRAFPGRFYIPTEELARLLGQVEASA